MKIFCEDCEGTGQSNEGFPYVICTTCKGKGYTEDPEVDHKIAVAEALEVAFEVGFIIMEEDYDYNYEEELIVNYITRASSAEQLLEWLENFRAQIAIINEQWEAWEEEEGVD